MTSKDLKKINDLNRQIFEMGCRLKELNTMLKRQEENKSTGIIKIEIISFDKVYHFLKESDIDNNLIQFLDEKLLEYKDNLELELNNLKKQFENIQFKMVNIEGEPHE